MSDHPKSETVGMSAMEIKVDPSRKIFGAFRVGNQS